MRLLEFLLRPVIGAWDKLDEWADLDTEADDLLSTTGNGLEQSSDE